MAMRKGTLYLKTLVRYKLGPTGQRLSDEINGCKGKMREFGQSLILDLTILAIVPPEQVGLVDLVLMLTMYSRHTHRTTLTHHGQKISN